jgi:hypothetical protein
MPSFELDPPPPPLPDELRATAVPGFFVLLLLLLLVFAPLFVAVLAIVFSRRMVGFAGSTHGRMRVSARPINGCELAFVEGRSMGLGPRQPRGAALGSYAPI